MQASKPSTTYASFPFTPINKNNFKNLPQNPHIFNQPTQISINKTSSSTFKNLKILPDAQLSQAHHHHYQHYLDQTGSGGPYVSINRH